MFPLRASKQLLTALVIMGCFAQLAHGGVIRHDGDDEDYMLLAEDYPSVGQIIVDFDNTDLQLLGVGTLIAPNWVLTAGHITAPELVYGVGAPVSLEFKLGETSYFAEQWVTHEDFGGNPMAGFDIGLVRFSENIQEESVVEPAKIYRGRKELGQVGTSVGFGQTGTGETGRIIGSHGTRRTGENVINSLLDYDIHPVLDGLIDFYALDEKYPNKRMFLSDFDEPKNPMTSTLGDEEPLPLEYLIAGGDSGGGVFVKGKKGDDLLVGLHSIIVGIDGTYNSDYGDLSGHIRVSQFSKWIKSTMRKPPRNVSTGDSVAVFNTAHAAYFAGVLVPEPSASGLFCMGVACVAGLRRPRARKKLGHQ